MIIHQHILKMLSSKKPTTSFELPLIPDEILIYYVDSTTIFRNMFIQKGYDIYLW